LVRGKGIFLNGWKQKENPRLKIYLKENLPAGTKVDQ